jgi:cytochrome P450
MVRYPDVQRKAQLEIDTVVGTGRFPTIKDQPRLPYVQAILKETLRWHPVTPQGTSAAFSFQTKELNHH